MESQKILKKDIFEVGARDKDRKLFDEVIPLPDGTSYNSYLIVGSEKIALIDTVDPTKKSVIFSNLDAVLNSLSRKDLNIDYIIANHAEQDHSGSIPFLLEKFPNAKVVTNAKCKEFLMSLLHIADDKFIIVNDYDGISLGNKTLKFIITPWVHWPETMCTYLVEDKILFSCDFFGSHYSDFNLFYDDGIDKNKIEIAAKRYYAEIMMSFRTMIKNNILKLEPLSIEIIAPSHGPVYGKPSFIIDLYKDWISDKVNKNIVIGYVSMHDSTKVMADYIEKKLIERKMSVIKVNLVGADIGDIAIAMVDTGTIIFGGPCFHVGMHPVMQNILFLFNALKPKTKIVSFFGSFGWGTRMPDIFKLSVSNVKAEMIEPIVVKGFPTINDFAILDNYVEEIVKKINLL
ncbi:MAG: FprA family A-type flavoprotein [Candidatus Woesearchaeota archaeon]|jgi:flavorubredoxin